MTLPRLLHAASVYHLAIWGVVLTTASCAVAQPVMTVIGGEETAVALAPGQVCYFGTVKATIHDDAGWGRIELTVTAIQAADEPTAQLRVPRVERVYFTPETQMSYYGRAETGLEPEAISSGTSVRAVVIEHEGRQQAQTVFVDGGARVYVDVSHEFFVNSYTCRLIDFADTVTAYCSINTRRQLRNFDVAYFEQIVTGVPFPEHEIRALTDYVRKGGSLVLRGNALTPLRAVLEAFGVRPTDVGTPGTLKVDPSIVALGAPEQIPIVEPSGHGSLTAPPDARTLIADPAGNAIAVSLAFGQGQVAVIYDGECATWNPDLDPKRRDAVRKATGAIIKSLMPAGRAKPGGAWTTVLGERSLELPGGVVASYSDTISSHAETAIKQLVDTYTWLRRYCTTTELPPHFQIHMLACDGGGYGSADAVGLRTIGPAHHIVGVAGHEFSHALTPAGFPTLFAEAWASVGGAMVWSGLGFGAPDAPTLSKVFQDEYRQLDPGGDKSDFAANAFFDKPYYHAAQVKLQWMIAALVEKHGAGFIPLLFEYRQAVRSRPDRLIDEMLDLLSLAAGEDLSAWYRELGITYHPVTDATEAKRSLTAYRRMRAAEAQGETDYARLKDTLLADDSWVSDWHLAGNLPGDDVSSVWVKDTADPTPPAGLVPHGFGEYPESLRRRGLLAMSPNRPAKEGEPWTPATLNREYAVPADGQARLCLGGVSVGVSSSTVHLYIDDLLVWSHVQSPQLGFFSSSLNLSPYAGQTVQLLLEVGDQWGSWVLLDYATILVGNR